MDKKEILALAERIACRHRKLSTTEVTEVCLKIASAYDSMVAANEPAPKPRAVWSCAPTDAVNCRCVVKPINPFEITGAPSMPPIMWRAVVDLNEKEWRDDDAIEISYGLDDHRWRSTIQEYRAGINPPRALNKWRFLTCEPGWLQCLNVTHRPAIFDGVPDEAMFIAMYPDGPGPTDSNDNYAHRAQRIADINWTIVLAVKRVLE